MTVYLSMDSRKKIYHTASCYYIQKIHTKNLMRMGEGEAARHGYHKCAYCGCRGLKLYYRLHHAQTQELHELHYDGHTDTLYVRTDAGFWKIYCKDGSGYCLYHRNSYDPKASLGTLMHGDYHRQKDVSSSNSIEKLIHYIDGHDKAKKIISIDYHLLPQHTRRQRHYYAIAEKKALRKERNERARRVDDLFAMIEEKEGIRDLSIC